MGRERRELKPRYAYEYPRAALAVDCAVFGLDEGDLKLLLIQRAIAPFRGGWALAGGFLRMDETLEQAAARELREETGLERVYLEQVQAFSAIGRDPRERVVSVAFFGLVKLKDHRVRAATDARDAAWFSTNDLPTLAFDHASIVEAALRRLRVRARREPIGLELLPPKFTLSELQRLYEVILERPLDKRNFRKKVLATGLVVELGEVEKDVAHRAARLYRFDARRYEQLRARGIDFEP
ncbi:MAG TPA: NUDIX domain-containing protein [Minicystis sp.]|nr:NUDIX domain-containing protein [Minicystis sp.]